MLSCVSQTRVLKVFNTTQKIKKKSILVRSEYIQLETSIIIVNANVYEYIVSTSNSVHSFILD